MKDLAKDLEHQIIIEKTKFNVTEQIHKETERKMQAQTKIIEEQKLTEQKRAANEIKKI